MKKLFLFTVIIAAGYLLFSQSGFGVKEKIVKLLPSYQFERLHNNVTKQVMAQIQEQYLAIKNQMQSSSQQQNEQLTHKVNALAEQVAMLNTQLLQLQSAEQKKEGIGKNVKRGDFLPKNNKLLSKNEYPNSNTRVTTKSAAAVIKLEKDIRDNPEIKKQTSSILASQSLTPQPEAEVKDNIVQAIPPAKEQLKNNPVTVVASVHANKLAETRAADQEQQKSIQLQRIIERMQNQSLALLGQ